MSEVEKTEGGMSKLKAFGGLAATVIGGLWLLGTAGLGGTVVLGLLGVAGTGAYGAYTGEGPFEKIKSLFSGIKDFYSEAFSVARAGFSTAKDWAETQQVARTAETGVAPVATKASAPDFEKAANVNTPVAVKTPKPAPAPKTQNMK